MSNLKQAYQHLTARRRRTSTRRMSNVTDLYGFLNDAPMWTTPGPSVWRWQCSSSTKRFVGNASDCANHPADKGELRTTTYCQHRRWDSQNQMCTHPTLIRSTVPPKSSHTKTSTVKDVPLRDRQREEVYKKGYLAISSVRISTSTHLSGWNRVWAYTTPL